MPRTKRELKGVTRLGAARTAYADRYAPQALEAFANKHPGRDYWVTLTCPEFTSLCPVTGQPDFATLTIQYVPAARLVESKSLKLYLFSFRNHGDFHEDCVNVILGDLVALLQPKYLEVLGRFHARGGIAIDPFVNFGAPGTPYEALAQERFRRRDGERR